MPKKKKTKDATTTEFKFDYRYTPKPYFTAPSTTASASNHSPQTNSPLTSRAAHPLRARTSLNTDAWQAQKQRNYGYSSYAKAATSTTHSSKASSIEVTPNPEETTPTNTNSQKDRETIRKVFEEMFKGRVDVTVINMVLHDVDWNENEALDTLSQIAPEESSHISSLTGFEAAMTLTPDHNLTPTAPTLSYSSSITSLDEYGMEYCRNLTQRNLSQVADMLRNGDDINDLDRQRLARSRATTPRTLVRNGNLTVKNISLGSTESLESNRSLFGQDPPGITYASASVDTPKKTNFDKSMSLHDISSAESSALLLSTARDQVDGGNTVGASSGTIESLLIPLDHGDIVLEKGTYDSLLNGDATTPQAELTPATHTGKCSASISDYSQAISSLTTQLTTDEDPEIGISDAQAKAPAARTDWRIGDSALAVESPLQHSLFNGATPLSNGAASLANDDSSLSDGATGQDKASSNSEASNGLTERHSSTAAYGKMLSTASSKEKPYPYDGLLGSGTAVPTAFESARPKKPKAPSKPAASEADEMRAIMEIAASAAEGEKVMFILRGAPGSGKSTLGRSLIGKSEGQIFSGDDFFTDSNGQYSWDPVKLQEAHAWNRSRVQKACEAGLTPIVVDNTHLQSWELEPCIKLCLQHAYRPMLAEPNTPWRYKAKELYKKNTHHVPLAKIKLMLERFEHKITVAQLIERVSSKDPHLQTMAEPVKSGSAPSKLSRKKPTSKTIKRNKQEDTVEKFKDKKMELTVDLPKKQEIEQEDGQGETEIMYPSAATLSMLKKSSTLKVLNREKTKANGAKPKTHDSKPKSHEAKSKARETKPKTDETKPEDSTQISMEFHAGIAGASNMADDLSSRGNEKEIAMEKHQLPSKKTEKSENRSSLAKNARDVVEKSMTKEPKLVVTPLATPPLATPSPASIIDKSVSVDTGLSESNKDHLVVSTHQKDQSIISDSTESGVEVRGATTLSHSFTMGDREQMLLPAQTASLPRCKGKSRSKISSKRSTSTSILNADVEQMERWLSNDWAAPPYPSTSVQSSASVVSFAPVPTASPASTTNAMTSSLASANSITSANAALPTSTTVTSSLDIMASSASAAILTAGELREPPPPYDESESSERAPVVSCHNFVKTKESWTLTEPSDYAMAYKAMQYNHQLPEGWVKISGHSKDPYPLPASIPYSSVITHDKGTAIGEDDIPLDMPSSQDLSAEAKLDRLHSCFPQLTKHQLSEFLDLCKGDETWATNLLLDSNKVSLVKKSKRAAAALSIAGLNKRLIHKGRSGKGSIVERFNRAIVPVTSCLGKMDTPLHPLTQDNVTLSLTQQQATDLHTAFGRGVELPSSFLNGDVTVDVPRWIAHKIYRCMTDQILAEGPDKVTVPSARPVLPVRPPRRQRKRRLSPKASLRTQQGAQHTHVSVDAQVHQANGLEASRGPVGLVTGDIINSLGADWTIVDNVDAPPAYAQEDEELARRLQTEDLMDVIKASQSTSKQKLAIIADEQYARSLMAEEVSKQHKPNLSAKLKLQKLHEMFAGVDKAFVDEVFKSCRYNLEQTVEFLSAHQGQGPTLASTAIASETKGRYNLVGRSNESPPRVLSNGTLSSRESTPGRDVSSSEHEDQWFDVEEYASNADYVDYRAEANLHMKQRKEFLEKAALANSKRKFPVGSYYAEQAELHYQKYREANLAAATQIFNHSNASRNKEEVDLHGLHADEAVQVVSEIIKTLRNEGTRKYVNVITGRGNRSKNGVSRIKQAVENFLIRNKICYRMENPGMMKVTL
ncbi:NEDD4-binding protein 2-like [Watersipora subatra]|uniref:NEDD4-binding protein 2-like n=1 Tax=Watersipora subatra TaxID=2589382 RepID=UPI00355C2667